MGNIDVKVKKTLKVTGGKTMVHLKNVKNAVTLPIFCQYLSL